MSPTLENSIIITGATVLLTFACNFIIEKRKSKWIEGLEKVKADLLKAMQVQIEEIKKEFMIEVQTHLIHFEKEYHYLTYLSEIIPHLLRALDDVLSASPEKLKDSLAVLEKKQFDVSETITIRGNFLKPEIKRLCLELLSFVECMRNDIVNFPARDKDLASKRFQERNTITNIYQDIKSAISERVGL